MTIKLGIVMDPISAINIKKDSSFAMLEEAQKRGYELFYLEMSISTWKPVAPLAPCAR